MNIFSSFVSKERIESKFQPLAQLDFSLFFETRPTHDQLALSDLNIFVLEEPNEYFGNHDWVIANKDKFSLILTWSERVLRSCNNAMLLLYGESWLDDGTDKITRHREKKFEVSHLRGGKLQSYGHWLRHQIYNRRNELIVPLKFHETIGKDDGNWENWKAGKEFILGDSMFSVITENSSHNNYFTEKITDCMLMRTIPIYWGCSNIENFYNPNGIYQFKSDDDAINIINGLRPEFYESRLDVIEENYKRAFEYKNYVRRMRDMITGIFKDQGIM